MEIHKAAVGVYDSHNKAISAVKRLHKHGVEVDNISLIGKAEIVEDHLHAYTRTDLTKVPILIGAVLGPVLGILAGVSIVAIPGLGFLVGAGAIAGASGGLALGGISGGLASTLMSLGIKKDELVRYKQHLETGSFMVIVHGTDKEIHEAQHILHTEGTHFELDTH